MSENNNTVQMPATQSNDGPKAMLVSLTFKFGRQGGQDDEITTQICSENGASDDSLKATKRTICKEAFEPLAKIRGEFSAAVKRVTIPWDIKGVYFCKPKNVAKIIALRDGNEEHQLPDGRVIPARLGYMNEFNRIKQEHLLDQYDKWREITQSKLGKAYKEDEFPSREDLTMNVFCKLSIMAMPEAEAIRKIHDIDEALVEELVKSNNERVKRSIQQGMVTAYNRLMEPLQKMVDVLTSDKPRIFETLVTNVKDVVDEIDGLNLADDPALNQFAEQAKSMIGNLTADHLRDSKVIRQKVANAANAIISNFGKPGVRKFAA
jgi:hypothetical protein